MSIFAILKAVADQGKGPGGHVPPLIFSPNRGPKGRKKLFHVKLLIFSKTLFVSFCLFVSLPSSKAENQRDSEGIRGAK